MNSQASAIESARNLRALMGSFRTLANQVNTYMNDFGDLDRDALWKEMKTVKVNPDGTPGEPDGTPNVANPIAVPEGAPLLVSRNELVNGVMMASSFQQWWSKAGGTMDLPQQANARTAAMITG